MSLSQIKSIITFRQDEEPVSKKAGDVWLNPRTQVVKTWTGTNWILNWKGYGLYGYSIGGVETIHTSVVERFNFPFNSGTATLRNSVSSNISQSAGCNSSTHAYLGGDSTNVYSIMSIEFPYDSGSSSNSGMLQSSSDETCSCNSSRHGFFMGGSLGPFAYHSNIERVSFPFNYGLASTVGNLSASKRSSAACNSSIEGYSFAGTNSAASDYLGTSTIDRIVFPFNSGTSSVSGYLFQHRRSRLGSFNSSEHGYAASGWFKQGVGYLYFTSIERVSFPWHTGVATIVGNASVSGYKEACCNSSRYGYMMGGFDGSIKYSIIDRVSFPFNSGTSSSVGSLNSSKYSNVGVDECDFVNQFI